MVHIRKNRTANLYENSPITINGQKYFFTDIVNSTAKRRRKCNTII